LGKKLVVAEWRKGWLGLLGGRPGLKGGLGRGARVVFCVAPSLAAKVEAPPMATNQSARSNGKQGGVADEWVKRGKKGKSVRSTSKIKTKMFLS